MSKWMFRKASPLSPDSDIEFLKYFFTLFRVENDLSVSTDVIGSAINMRII